ncbi:MAG: hypothetical protein MZV64_51510 [Ignavibacteriales bacterium]|nr:hypothetical protein [Ignavibacteriales bacterium]
MSDDIKKDKKTEEIETSEWLYSLDYVFQNTADRKELVELLQQLADTCTQSRSSNSFQCKHSVHKYNPERKAAAVSRQQGN